MSGYEESTIHLPVLFQLVEELLVFPTKTTCTAANLSLQKIISSPEGLNKRMEFRRMPLKGNSDSLHFLSYFLSTAFQWHHVELLNTVLYGLPATLPTSIRDLSVKNLQMLLTTISRNSPELHVLSHLSSDIFHFTHSHLPYPSNTMKVHFSVLNPLYSTRVQATKSSPLLSRKKPQISILILAFCCRGREY